MQAERDHLRAYVFPELEERLKGLKHHLEWVDLRVGVATSHLRDDHERELQILKVCLSEVRRCRPFLIVLLGDRYGWVPPPERAELTLQEQAIPGDFSGCSVTDLEIRFGALAEAGATTRSYFYFREPLAYSAMRPGLAAEYSDAIDQGSIGQHCIARLSALKDAIAARFPDRIRRYGVDWDSGRETVTGLDAWGRMVVEDLWSDLTAEASNGRTISLPGRVLTWQQIEREALEDFENDRARDVVGRSELLADIDAFATSTATAATRWGLCITGPPGAGKSAVWGEACRRLRRHDVILLAHAAGASARATSVEDMLRRWIEELGQALGVQEALGVDVTAETIQSVFHGLLARAAGERRVVVLIDALDQFEPTARARHLTWLPRVWPENARLFATAVDGDAATALSRRAGVLVATIESLAAPDARRIVEGIFRRYHRSIEPEVMEALFEGRPTAGPSSTPQPLWLVLAAEELNLVDADDFARSKQHYAGAPSEQLRALLVDRARAMPATPADLFRATFRHAESLFSRPLTLSFLSLIALGRSGWRELDFRALLPRLSGESWDELRFASLRRTFRGQVAQTGPFRQWNCRHQQMREAAFLHLSAEHIALAPLHGLIADHLLSLPADDTLRLSEGMRQLCAAGYFQRVAAYFGDQSMEQEELSSAAGALADLVAEEVREQPLGVITALLDARNPNEALAETVATRCLHHVRARLSGRVPLPLQIGFADLVKTAFEKLSAADTLSFERRFYLSSVNLGRAMLLDDQGERPAARAGYEAALRIVQQLMNNHPADPRLLLQALLVRQKLHSVTRAGGELDAALGMSTASIDDARALTAIEPDNDLAHRQLAMAYEGQSSDLIAKGDLSGAAAAQHSALDIARSLSARQPDAKQHKIDEAHAHVRMSEIQAMRRDMAAAEASCRTGVALLERIAALEPDDVAARANLAVATSMLGKCFLRRRDLLGASWTFAIAADLLGLLTRLDASNASWQRSLAVLRVDQGTLAIAEDRLADAGRLFEDARAIMNALVERDPDNLQWLRDSAGFEHALADQRMKSGDPVAAAHGLAKALELTEAWAAAEPGNTAPKRELALRHDAIAHAGLKAGDIDRATQHAHMALEICESLIELDRTNIAWRRDVAGIMGTLGEVAKSRGDWNDAVKWRSLAAEGLAGITNSRRDDAITRIECAVLFEQLGESQTLSGDLDEAARAFGRALEQLTARELSREDTDANAERIVSLYLKLGLTFREAAESAKSARAYRSALDLCKDMAKREPSQVTWRLGSARACDGLAQNSAMGNDTAGSLAFFKAAIEAWQNLASEDHSLAHRLGHARARFAFAHAIVGLGDITAAERVASPGAMRGSW